MVRAGAEAKIKTVQPIAADKHFQVLRGRCGAHRIAANARGVRMNAFENVATRGARFAVACALGVLVMACGGSDDAINPSSAPAAVADLPQGPAVAAVAAQARSTQKPPRSRPLRGVTALNVDGSLAVAGADGSVQIETDSSAERGKARVASSKLVGATGVAATAVAFSADGKHLFGVGRDSVASVWSVGSRQRLMSMHGHEHAIRTLAVSADGAYVATAGEETRVMLWNATTGKLVKVLGGHTSFVNAVAFSPDSRTLAAGDASGKVTLWSLADSAARRLLAAHTDEINSLAFSPDGRTLATGGEDGRVLLWDANNGQKVHAFEDRQTPVRALAFSKDGEWLASGGEESKVLVWDLSTRKLSKSLATDAAVNALTFDTRERKQILLVGDVAGQVSRWDVAVGVPR
jgi:WD40 repeat protein